MTRMTWIALVWSGAIGITVLLMSTVLTWAGTRGYAGSVIQNNYKQQNDATALFWTESPRTLEILERMDRQRSKNDE